MSGKRKRVMNSGMDTSWVMGAGNPACMEGEGLELLMATETLVHLDEDQAPTRWDLENQKAKRVNRWFRRKHRKKIADSE